MTRENIAKAAQTSELLCQDLREALKSATAVEGIVILGLIADAATLRTRLNNLLLAMQES